MTLGKWATTQLVRTKQYARTFTTTSITQQTTQNITTPIIISTTPPHILSCLNAVSRWAARKHAEHTCEAFRYHVGLIKDVSLVGQPCEHYISHDADIQQDDRKHTARISPTDPRFSHLMPLLAIRSWRPSPYAIPFLQDESFPKCQKLQRRWFQTSLTLQQRLHVHFLQAVGADRWIYASLNKAITEQPQLLDDERYLFDKAEQRKHIIIARHRELRSLLFEYYGEIFGVDAQKELHLNMYRYGYVEELASNLAEQRILDIRENTLSSSPVRGAGFLQIMRSTATQRSELLSRLPIILGRIGFKGAGRGKRWIANDSDVVELLTIADTALSVVTQYRSWCTEVVWKIFEEQRTWVEPPEASRPNFPGYQLARPVISRRYPVSIRTPRPKIEAPPTGAPFADSYHYHAQRELIDRQFNPKLADAPPSFALVLSKYYNVLSARYKFELYRHRRALIEVTRREQEENKTQTLAKFRQRQQQRYWSTRKNEMNLWLDVLHEEVKHTLDSSAKLEIVIQRWQLALEDRKPSVLDIIQLCKSCLPYIQLRDRLPRLSTFEQYALPLSVTHPDTVPAAPYPQSYFSLPFSVDYSPDSTDAALWFFHDPNASSKLSIVLVNVRLDFVSMIARGITSSFVSSTSSQPMSSNWLELRPDESSDSIEADASSIVPVENFDSDSTILLNLLKKHHISPTSLPEFVQDGWLMVDLGQLMLISCSDPSLLSTWIPIDNQTRTQVSEQQFVEVCEVSPPTIDHCNVLVKSTHSTIVALNSEKFNQ